MGYREWAQANQIRGDGEMAYLGEVLKVNSMLIAPESVSDEQKKATKHGWMSLFWRR